MKLLDNNTGENLDDLGFGNQLFKMQHQRQNHERKLIIWTLLEFQTSMQKNTPVLRDRKKSYSFGESIYKTHIIIEDIYPKYIRNSKT